MYETIDGNLTDCNVGSRKKRNVRDNLFVLNAILTSTKLKNMEAHDICIYDINKCFDTMWVFKSLNDIYELCFKDNKLPLIFQKNSNARIAIKTSSGITSRMNIDNTIIQGTVRAGLLCTGTMDKLGKLVYSEEQLSYKYLNKVHVPPSLMVDDVLTVSKCGQNSIKLNSTVNTFVYSKKVGAQ